VQPLSTTDSSTRWRVATHNRWVIATAGAVVMMTIGTIYSWAIFTQPLLVGFRWDVTATTWAYAMANFCLAAIGTAIGGFWQDRVGPRRVAVTGVLLWSGGNIAAGLGTPVCGALWLYLSYGVIGGVGAGMVYISSVSMVTKWFPDRRGLAGGLVAGGFGLGAFFYNQVVPRLTAFHTASLHAGEEIVTKAILMTPSDIAAVMHVFVGSGGIYLLVGLLGASFYRNPPPLIARENCFASPHANRGLRPSQVIRTPQFYLLWLQLFANVIVGVTIISNAVFILQDLTRLSMESIAPLFGIISLFNVAGRVFWGAVSDRIGCRASFAAMFAIQAGILLLLTDMHDLPMALAGFGAILLCCGGGFGVMPSYNVEYFGTRFLGLNYALILSAWGAAGLVGPVLVARAKDLSGSFVGMLPLTASILLLSVVLPLLTVRPRSAAAWAWGSRIPDVRETG
jgi:OFA family oxalate/formate antiporter-like MFS transporter